MHIGLNMCLKLIYVYWAEHVPEGHLYIYISLNMCLKVIYIYILA